MHAIIDYWTRAAGAIEQNPHTTLGVVVAYLVWRIAAFAFGW